MCTRAGRRCLFSWPSPVLWLHTDKLALKAAGGKAGFPMTISTMQLGVGVLYALFAWIAPEMRDTPAPTIEDLTKMIPVSFCAAAAHSFSVFAQSAGAVSFAMIVKAAEPAFAAVVGTLTGSVLQLQRLRCAAPMLFFSATSTIWTTLLTLALFAIGAMGLHATLTSRL